MEESLAFVEIQTAISSVLSQQIGCRIYDRVPESATFPYAVYGEIKDFRFGAREVRGRLVTVPIHVYSRDAGGRFEAAELMNTIVETLTATRLEMTGWTELWKTATASDVSRNTGEPKAANYKGMVEVQISVNRSKA